MRLKVLITGAEERALTAARLSPPRFPLHSVDVAANSQEAPPPTEASPPVPPPSPWLQRLAAAVTALHTHLPASLTPLLSATHVSITPPETSLFTVTEAFQGMFWCNNHLCC